MRIGILSLNTIGSVFKRTKLDKNLLREGEELLSSKLPFKGDYFVSSGIKLANGPKTLFKELKSFNFTKVEFDEITTLLGSNPNLYTALSREINNITNSNILKNIPISKLKKTLIQDLKEIAPYLKDNPDKIKSFVGYAKFLSVNTTTNAVLDAKALLKEGIYDFDTAAELMKSISKNKSQFYYCAEIPQIIKESNISKEQLIKIFDSAISLSDMPSKIGIIQNFSKRILANINQDSKQLFELIQDLASEKKLKSMFSTEELESVVKNLDSKWKKDFIINFKNSNNRDNIANYLNSLKNEKQSELILQELSLNNNNNSFLRLLKNNVIENEYQIELYKILKNYKIKIQSKSGAGFDSKVKRFPELALQDILKNVRNETDFQIVKNMIDKQGIGGEDLYSPSAIVKILEQKQEKKIQILEKLKKTISFDRIRSDENLMQQFMSRIYKMEKSLFQKELKYFSSKIPLEKLQTVIPEGDVAVIGNKLMVNDGKKLIELQIDEKTFKNLFLSDGFTFQGQNLDCGLVATLDSLMATPKGKAHIYSLFESLPDSNGFIINLHGFKSKIKYPGEFVEANGNMDSIKGLQALENAITVAESPWIKAEQGIIIMHDNLVIFGKNSPIKGIAPGKVMNYIVGKDNFKEFSLRTLDTSDLKNTMSKINCKKNSFAIFGTRSYCNVETLAKLMCGSHYHGIRASNPDGSLKLVNPHETNLSAKIDYYTVTNPDIMSQSCYFELI